MTEPGILTKIGLNSAGIGVCLNINGGTEESNGLPIHLLLRSILDAKTIDEAISMTLRSRAGTMSTIMVGDSHGECATIEILGSQVRIERKVSTPVVHTNHYILHTGQVTSSYFSDSFDRFDTALALASKPALSGVEQLKAILLDQSHSINPINVPFEEIAGLGQVGTIVHVVMSLAERVLYISRAGMADGKFERVALTTAH